MHIYLKILILILIIIKWSINMELTKHKIVQYFTVALILTLSVFLSSCQGGGGSNSSKPATANSITSFLKIFNTLPMLFGFAKVSVDN